MSFSFKIERPKDLIYVLSKLKSEAGQHNISFKGDEKRGSASGYGFVGEYTVYTDNIELTVHKKPFIVTEAKIKQTVKEFMAKIESESNLR